MSRDATGVHYRSDSVRGLFVGEQQALGLLRDHSRTYNERFDGFIVRKFNGEAETDAMRAFRSWIVAAAQVQNVRMRCLVCMGGARFGFDLRNVALDSSADPKRSKSDNTAGSYLHRQVQMVNTSCGSRTPLSECRPTDNNGSRTPSAACTNDVEIRIGLPNTLQSPSRRAASFTAGPITVKSRRSAVPMLPYVTSPACSAMSKLSAGLPAAVSVALSASTRASISRAAASTAGVTTARSAPSGGRNTASTPSPKNLRISPPAARSGSPGQSKMPLRRRVTSSGAVSSAKLVKPRTSAQRMAAAIRLTEPRCTCPVLTRSAASPPR